jgi:RPA family protein
MAMQRSVAYRVWISEIGSGPYVKQEGFNPNYIELKGKQVSRVQIMGTVVGTFTSEDGNYGALTLDDGSDTIRVKAFGPDVANIKDAKVGQLVRFVGKIKEYNDERYLAPDFAAKVEDPNWVTVWKLELGEAPEAVKATEAPMTENKPTQTQVEQAPAGEKPDTDKSEKSSAVSSDNSEDLPNFAAIIAKLDSGDGAEMDKVISESKLDEAEAKLHIIDLLKQGEVYEPRKGKLKVL